MTGITRIQAEAQLAIWLAASEKVALGQSYSIGGRSLSRANAKEIRDNIIFWNDMIHSLTRNGIKIRGGVPC